ncbi:MAG: cysteine peptidase family C39 domain-containing protein [Planctomycetota bacterium]|nr:cysteine peptidase family C39 domain-containing protein [Planctomycetota bacterium]
MYPVSFTGNAVAMIIGIFIGITESARLVRRDPAAAPEDLLKVGRVFRKAPYLLVPIALVMAYSIFCLASSWDISTRWILPLWFQLRGQPILWAALLGVVTFLASLSAAASFRAGDPRRWKLVFAFSLLVGSMYFLIYNLNAPIAPRLVELVDEDGVILQTSGVSCVAASAANIVRLYGIERTEKAMAEILGTTRMGTTMAQFIYGLEGMGFECRTVERPDGEPMELEAPAVLLVDHPRTPREGHAVAYMGKREGLFEILDPTLGRIRLTQKQVSAIWHGHAVECRKVDR